VDIVEPQYKEGIGGIPQSEHEHCGEKEPEIPAQIQGRLTGSSSFFLPLGASRFPQGKQDDEKYNCWHGRAKNHLFD